MKEGLNLELLLREYVPDLFKIMKGQKISWVSINKNYQTLENDRQRKYDKNCGPIQVQPNFYDLIIRSINGDHSFIRLFIYVNIVLKNLDEHLTPIERIMVGSILRNLLKTLTLDYLHFLGELFIINNTISRRHLYTLKTVEYPLNNGKKIDFNVVSKLSGKEGLLEVMNVRLQGVDLSNHNSIKQHLERKIEDKIKDKTKDVEPTLNVFIQPVLWGSSDELKLVSDFFKNGSGINIDNVNEPYSFCCHFLQRNGRIESYYMFTEISKLFDIDY